MDDTVKKSIPGSGEYEEIAFDAKSVAEYKKQAPKKSA